MVNNQLGHRIKKLRVERNYSQRYMAEKLGFSQQNSYSKLENGISPITYDRLVKIAEILKVPVDSFLDSDQRTFHVESKVSKVNQYYVENLHEDGKGAKQESFDLLKDENHFLRDEIVKKDDQIAQLLHLLDKR